MPTTIDVPPPCCQLPTQSCTHPGALPLCTSQVAQLARLVRQLKDIDEWSSSPQHAQHVAIALAGLAANNQPVKAAIAAVGAVPPLVRLLGHSDRDVREAAAAVMRNLTNSQEVVQRLLIKEDDVAALQRRARGSSNMQDNIKCAVRNLADCDVAQQAPQLR